MTDCDKDRHDDNDDDDVFPGPIQLPDSDDSNFGDEEDRDLDQIKMQNAPLSTSDTEEQLTIPSGEDTEASTVQ